MAATSLLARLGLRVATLGSAASLAIAAPIAEGDVSQAAHTHAARSGIYFPTATSMGVVLGGTERARYGGDTFYLAPNKNVADAGININPTAIGTPITLRDVSGFTCDASKMGFRALNNPTTATTGSAALYLYTDTNGAAGDLVTAGLYHVARLGSSTGSHYGVYCTTSFHGVSGPTIHYGGRFVLNAVNNTTEHHGVSVQFASSATTITVARAFEASVASSSSSGVNTSCFYGALTTNQSGTAGYDAFFLQVTETATGSGAKHVIRTRVASTDVFAVTNAGVVSASGTIYSVTDALTDAATINYVASDSDNFTLLLTSAVGGTRQLATPTGLVSGMRWVIRVTQPASGGPCALTFSADYKFPFGITPVLSTAANSIDSISCYYDGAVILAQVINSYGLTAGVVVTGNSLNLPNEAISTNTTLDVSQHTVHVDASAGPVTITLPDTASSGVPGRIYNIKKVDATVNAVIIQRSGTDVIDGATSIPPMTVQYQVRSVHARTAGGAWDII